MAVATSTTSKSTSFWLCTNNCRRRRLRRCYLTIGLEEGVNPRRLLRPNLSLRFPSLPQIPPCQEWRLQCFAASFGQSPKKSSRRFRRHPHGCKGWSGHQRTQRRPRIHMQQYQKRQSSSGLAVNEQSEIGQRLTFDGKK